MKLRLARQHGHAHMPKTHSEGHRSPLIENAKAVRGAIAQVHPSGSFDVYIPESNTLSLCFANRAGEFKPVHGQAVRCLLEFGTYGHVTAIEPAAEAASAGAEAPRQAVGYLAAAMVRPH